MLKERINLYKKLQEIQDNSSILVYITGDRQGMETVMHPEVLDRFVDHLDSFKNPQKITLVLHSRGGDTSAGWSLANLIRSFCKEFEIIIPSRAHSSATLLCLGADRIIMTKQATLGPIDPNVNTPLNPPVPGANPNARFGVSVEAIKGFVQLAKDEFDINKSSDMASILSVLSNNVHPLVLGSAFRARAHIRMLATNLLEKHLKNEKRKKKKIEKIVNFLCSDSGSHDYTINRTEARDSLGLKIVRPTDDLYNVIASIYKNIEEELELKSRFDPALLIANEDRKTYSCRRALIESLTSGTDVFISEGTISKQNIQTPNGVLTQIQDHRSFEGWRKENV